MDKLKFLKAYVQNPKAIAQFGDITTRFAEFKKIIEESSDTLEAIKLLLGDAQKAISLINEHRDLYIRAYGLDMLKDLEKAFYDFENTFMDLLDDSE